MKSVDKKKMLSDKNPTNLNNIHNEKFMLTFE